MLNRACRASSFCKGEGRGEEGGREGEKVQEIETQFWGHPNFVCGKCAAACQL